MTSNPPPLIKSRFFTSKNKDQSPIKIEYETDTKTSNKRKLNLEEISTTNTTPTTNTTSTTTTNNSSIKKNESLARVYYQDVWDKISKSRSEIKAPVDYAGAESFDIKEINEKDRRFHILVGCLLSSQTRDQVTHAAMNRLKSHGLTIENILKTDDPVIESLMTPVSFYKRKTIYLKKIAKILKEQYNGDIPNTYDELMNLPGVGPKMTLLILQIAWKRVEGIAVDVHMHRICNRLGWTNTKMPEDTRKALESWLPKEKWSVVNHLLVGFGQTVCLPIKPKCSDCYINHLCPTGILNLKTPNKKSKSKKGKEDEEEEEEVENEEENQELEEEQEIIPESKSKKKSKKK